MTETRFVRSTSVLFRRTTNEVLLSSSTQAGVDALSGSAAVVWDILEEPRTAAAIVDELAAFFDAPRPEIAPQVEALLGELVDRGWAFEVPGG